MTRDGQWDIIMGRRIIPFPDHQEQAVRRELKRDIASGKTDPAAGQSGPEKKAEIERRMQEANNLKREVLKKYL